MIYLLLIVFPLATAAGSFVLRRDGTLVAWLGVSAIAAELWLALSVPVDQPARLLELSISYTELSQLILACSCLGSLAIALTALVEPPGEYFLATLLLILGLTAGMLVVQEPFVVASLLLLASLLGGLQLVDQPVGSPRLLGPQAIGVALKYTLLLSLGGLLLLIGFVLATAFEGQLASSGPALSRTVFGLLLIGFAIRAGLIPFHLWLPDVLDETPASTIFVQAGLLTSLAMPVLIVALQTQPQLLIGNGSGRRLLLGLGGLSAIGGALLALGSVQPRRRVAFLLIANLGLLTVGLGLTTVAGVSAALLGGLNHILGAALVALGLALLERSVPGRREQAGALRERPLAATALVLGVLMVVGLPPLSGFVPKLILVRALAGQGWIMSVVVATAWVLSGLAAARLLSQVLLQPRDAPTTRSLFSDDLDRLAVVGVPYAPRLLLVLIVTLGALALLGGLWPAPIVARIDATVRGLAFLRQ